MGMTHNQAFKTIRLNIDAAGEYENAIWYRIRIRLASFNKFIRVKFLTIFLPGLA